MTTAAVGNCASRARGRQPRALRFIPDRNQLPSGNMWGVSGQRPPSADIALYGQEFVTCPACGARPGAECIEQAERWRSICKARFADAAKAYVPAWKDANGRRKPAA